MHTIFLDQWHDEPLTISDEGYKQLCALVPQHLVCHTCEKPYTGQIPQVGKNLCLSCLLTYLSDLTYVGPYDTSEKGRTTFKFLNQEGVVHLSTEGSSHKAEESIPHTLLHWGFPAPSTYATPQGEVKLSPHNWHIHGQLCTSVIVVEYQQSYGPKFTVAFLSYKGHVYKELSKRDAETKLLLQRARATIEATRDQQGRHYAGKHPTYTISDSHLYEVVAAMEAAVYDVQVQIRSKKPAEVQEADHEEVMAS